jgi:signal transduction histidine kinase/ligand-binding sensor domain-containing protein
MPIAKLFAFLAVLSGLAWSWPSAALALDPSLDARQYGHVAWRSQDSFAVRDIYSIAQTPDGYLWLAGASGLKRFDGVRAEAWRPPAGASLPSNHVNALLGTRDGALWIGTIAGLARWKDGKLVVDPRFAAHEIGLLVQDREGTIWVSGQAKSKGFLCAIRRGNTECHGEDGSLGETVYSVHESPEGRLWVYATNGVWLWKPGPPRRYQAPRLSRCTTQTLSETPNDAILASTSDGLRQVAGDKLEVAALPWPPEAGSTSCILRDRDGGLWIGSQEAGLVHFHQGRMDLFSMSDGLSGKLIKRLFEDREGNIWVATDKGLDRFRALSAATFSSPQGLTDIPSSVLADRDGSLLVGTPTGLFRWRDGRMTAYRAQRPAPGLMVTADQVVVPGLPDHVAPSLFQDQRGRIWFGGGYLARFGHLENSRFIPLNGVPPGFVDAIVEDAQGSLWIAHRDAGLLRISSDLSVEPAPGAPAFGRGALRLASDPLRGGLWIGRFGGGGVVRLANGRVRETYSAADGLGGGRVYDVRVSADGSVWAATDGGLSRINKAGRIATLDSRSGLPCDQVLATVEADDGATWAYTACGMARIARAELDAWSAAVDRGQARPAIRPLILGESDGVADNTNGVSTASPHLVKTADGKLWFVASDGVTMVDPRRLHLNPLPPPVHIEQVTADDTVRDPAPGLKLPALTRYLAIDYTALSLAAPEKVHFRYKLDGFDKTWREVVNVRQALYTNLPPKDYRFRVIASNNDGVWNTVGDALDFSIAPAWWQTDWFGMSALLTVLLMLAGGYWLRIRAIHREHDIERRLQNLRLELAHANRVAGMGQLTASIVHEVSQPLSGIITNASTSRRMLSAEQPDIQGALAASERTIRDGNRARDVVARLRAMFSKREAGAELLALRDVAGEVIALTAHELRRREVALQSRFEGDPRFVRGDRVQLQQVILNLVLNGADAMAEVTDRPKLLTIEVRFDPKLGVCLSVSDTGTGLGDTDPKRLFEAFFTTKEGGMGIGLSVSRSIIEAHGGTISAANNEGPGATFRFTLPLAKETGRTGGGDPSGPNGPLPGR